MIYLCQRGFWSTVKGAQQPTATTVKTTAVFANIHSRRQRERSIQMPEVKKKKKYIYTSKVQPINIGTYASGVFRKSILPTAPNVALREKAS